MTDLLASLNDEQRQAVSATPGNQLILAGAGSGKTRVLVHRIAWLLQNTDITPYGIMAVTFTNKASREMRERIEEVLGFPARGMWVGTFHGLAHRLLKAHFKDAKLPENFQILDSDDQLRLLKKLVKQLNIDDERFPTKEIQWWINGQKDEGRRAAHIQAWDPQTEAQLTVYSAYEEACLRGGFVDFGELLLRAHELLRDNQHLLEHYRERFQYVLVDEFQDTNTIQYAWLRLLAGETGAVTAVGDDDQSIYGWRGAKIENIQQFEQEFSGVRTTRLEQNYRSTGSILKAANAVIENNDDRLGKELWTESDDGEAISLYSAFNEQDEAHFITERIEQWVEQGHRRDSSAILYRSNAQSRVLEEALIRAGIPYRIYGGQRFYDRLEIKNALAYLRLVISRNDDTALERVINVPTRGIGNKTVDVVREFARDHGCSMWEAMQQVLQHKLLTARAGNALISFMHLIDQMDQATDDLSLAEMTEQAIEMSGLKDHHLKEKGEKAQARLENLDELVTAAKVYDADEEQPASPLRQFLDDAALDAGEQQAEENIDSVQLMTLHSAKGLEFPQVFLAGVEKNIFPHKMSFDEPGRLAEERRLCYVGITRAMEKLYICYAESRRLHGKESFNGPSAFIREIPSSVIEEVRLRTQVTRPVSAVKGFSSVHAAADLGVKLGQRVFHQKFGEGVIMAVEGAGGNARLQINFDYEGSKWLVMQYANLRPMEE
ncbi:DNA helicase-2/ATP-dependent DNA helicase PcrA [Sinobacterium caligoides]|uniref:DNA 3'-5' helicase n=1 Tax=Sinobacterium caligoides TaxID=933926 RepID=A0A3N2DHH6_9GAMM|nr:DNA helicase II [Sinobacterium caligoides]ROR99068.1 DNA helicase-2/ATP-dependent DNA helicase PcrA [Sinobacterium caligoides]